MRLSDAAVALATIALGASGALAADAAALGATEDARLADLRYDVKIRMPSGKHPCEIEPNQDVVRAVQGAAYDGLLAGVSSLPAETDVRLRCVCEGEACDEACEASFAVPADDFVSNPELGVRGGDAKAAPRLGEPADRVAGADDYNHGFVPDDASDRASLGNQRYFTLYDRCTTSADYLASHPVAKIGITEQDGVDELEVKCLRPRFRDLFPAQCPHRPDGPMLVATDSCMPFVPEGAPRYLTLWDKCVSNWMFRNNGRRTVRGSHRAGRVATTRCTAGTSNSPSNTRISARPPSSAKRFAGRWRTVRRARRRCFAGCIKTKTAPTATRPMPSLGETPPRWSWTPSTNPSTRVSRNTWTS